MLRRLLILGAVLLMAAAIGLYWAWNTTKIEIDRTERVIAPTSAKSAPENYAFGYQPDLAYSEPRAPCADRDPLKRAFFGDLHVHTALSADAFPDGARAWPEEAYRFAQGEAVPLPLRDGPAVMSQLDRPLDFAAITDHSESIGEGYICRTPGAFPGYDSKECRTFRKGEEAGLRMFTVVHAVLDPKRKTAVCGKDGEDCRAAARIVWQRLIKAAEDAYDRSADCAFTSFVGYEYTRSPSGMHMHRNTIFRNAAVPENPGNYIDYPTLPSLLHKLETECRQGIEACDVISIPHNSNLSGGNGFNPASLAGFPEDAQQAHRAQRQAFDRLMEITQHKGTSECLNGVTDILGDDDAYCEEEQVRAFGQRVRAFDLTAYLPKLYSTNLGECGPDDLDPKDNLYKGPCLSSRDYARGAWLEGLTEHTHYGINPFEMGVIGSTDTHIGAAGLTDEAAFPGHVAQETTLPGRLQLPALGRHNRIEGNPGGLAGVWAVENSRDALFQSMKRREAFATTGTRIAPRFFAGQYPDDICEQPDWLETAYARGVPMGAKLPAQTEPVALIAQATRDPHGSANPLKALQVIKGWVDADGQKHSKVITVAGDADASTDAPGADQFCAVWHDPDYDPALPTYYYMRAIETPTPRWSSAQCEAATDKPAECGAIPTDLTHELAWTSPIWLVPEPY